MKAEIFSEDEIYLWDNCVEHETKKGWFKGDICSRTKNNCIKFTFGLNEKHPMYGELIQLMVKHKCVSGDFEMKMDEYLPAKDPVFPNKPYVVGEKGPELKDPGFFYD